MKQILALTVITFLLLGCSVEEEEDKKDKDKTKENRNTIESGLGESYSAKVFESTNNQITLTVRERGITLEFEVTSDTSETFCNVGEIIFNQDVVEIDVGAYQTSDEETPFDEHISVFLDANAVLYDADEPCKRFAPGTVAVIDVFMENRMAISTENSFRYYNKYEFPNIDATVSRSEITDNNAE